MPSRVIRDGLLESTRYWSVSVEARMLFVHLMLLADDFGLVDAEPGFARRRCYSNELPPVGKVTRLLGELHTQDLVRLYFHDGRRYGFIPKFGQRLRTSKARHPYPPEATLADDKDAAKLFRENKHLFPKMADGCQQHDGRPRPEVDLERKSNEVESKHHINGKEKAAFQKSVYRDMPDFIERNGYRRQQGETELAFQKRMADAYIKASLGSGVPS